MALRKPNSDERRVWLDIIASSRQHLMSFFKLVENLTSKKEDRSIKLMINSLLVSDKSLFASQVVKMT